MNFTIYFAVSGQLTTHVSIYDCGELDDYCVDNESVDGYEEQLDMTRNIFKGLGMELVGVAGQTCYCSTDFCNKDESILQTAPAPEEELQRDEL